MGALDDMLAAATTEPAGPGDPTHIVVKVGDDGTVTHPLPLPGGRTPEQWLAELSEAFGPAWATSAVWTLAHIVGRRSDGVPTQPWAPVAP